VDGNDKNIKSLEFLGLDYYYYYYYYYFAYFVRYIVTLQMQGHLTVEGTGRGHSRAGLQLISSKIQVMSIKVGPLPGYRLLILRMRTFGRGGWYRTPRI
jgi:hypothetical protein